MKLKKVRDITKDQFNRTIVNVETVKGALITLGACQIYRNTICNTCNCIGQQVYKVQDFIRFVKDSPLLSKEDVKTIINHLRLIHIQQFNLMITTKNGRLGDD